MLGSLLLSACLTTTPGPAAPSPDVSWIQEGQTTREEVIAKLGRPILTLQTTYAGEVAEYAEHRTGQAARAQPRGASPLQLEPRPEGPAPQAFQPPIEAVRESLEDTDIQQKLWILYDKHGVVRDFGFGASPMKSSRSVR